jgi:uncharacterized protein with GYD domain
MNSFRTKESIMATFIALLNFTEQGVRRFKDTARRADAFKKAAKVVGVDIKDVYWTLGAYDGVLVFEAPDDQAAAGVMVSLGTKGNVHSHTLRAFTRQEIGGVIGKAR